PARYPTTTSPSNHLVRRRLGPPRRRRSPDTSVTDPANLEARFVIRRPGATLGAEYAGFVAVPRLRAGLDHGGEIPAGGSCSRRRGGTGGSPLPAGSVPALRREPFRSRAHDRERQVAGRVGRFAARRRILVALRGGRERGCSPLRPGQDG